MAEYRVTRVSINTEGVRETQELGPVGADSLDDAIVALGDIALVRSGGSFKVEPVDGGEAAVANIPALAPGQEIHPRAASQRYVVPEPV